MNHALSKTVTSAVHWLASRRDLCADPDELMESCQAWADAMQRANDSIDSLVELDTQTMEIAYHQGGIHAAREVARPCRKITMNIINPEDLL